ncbi:hypothetical protein DKG77_00380 [Flagellimonas aquimarina]|uniref:Uncharacterized protein n=1 Tax=Flagellimonas aquimarina TaxID=2201895 RepID=A0A316LGX5_9FLAO|nr:hypothetical protein [Allomuricauda koreensis]PWL39330.1 hypothetical protein DKG77_00380 [Allomuricauda koreensis]
MGKYVVLRGVWLPEFYSILIENYFNMKKLKHYPNVWQASPFSMEMFAHYEKEARINNQETEIQKQEIKKEQKSKFKLAFGW